MLNQTFAIRTNIRQQTYPGGSHPPSLYSYQIETGSTRTGFNTQVGHDINGDFLSTRWNRQTFRTVVEQPLVRDSRPFTDFGEYSLLWPSIEGFASYGHPDLNLPDRSNCDAEAITKALTSGKNRLQLGASLGESKQTASMFIDNAIIAARAALAAKNGQWGAIPGILGMSRRDVLSGRFGANRWLEYQYGWKPLFSDLHSLAESLKREKREGDQIALYGSASTSAFNSGYYGSGYDFEYSLEYSVRVKLYYRIEHLKLFRMAQNGLINPLSVAWELVPFSFVLDWFIPVGNVLDGLTSTLGLSYIHGYKGVRLRSTRKYTSTIRGPEVVQNGHVSFQGTSYDRYPLDSEPSAQFYADTSPFSPTRAANALALVRQLLFR